MRADPDSCLGLLLQAGVDAALPILIVLPFAALAIFIRNRFS